MTAKWWSKWWSNSKCARITVSQFAFSLGKFGADERIRTADLLITNQLLYQLSYVGPTR